jgi:hypothetical protein
MAVTTAFNQFATLIRENMGSSVLDLQLPEVDDPAVSMIATMEPLGKAGRHESGEDKWEARRKVKLSRGGMVVGGTFAGNTVKGMGSGDILPIGQVATAKAPSPEKVPLTQYATLKCQLKRMIGNVVVNWTQVVADLIGDDLEEVAVGHIEDAVYQVRKNLLAHFYSNGTSMLATSDGTYSVDTTAGGVAVGITAGRIARFIKNQRYIFFTGATYVPGTTTTRKGGIARLVNIDDNAAKLYFEMEEGEDTASLIAGDVICLADSVSAGAAGVSLMPTGIEYMFKETGELYGIADITIYPELISYVEGSETVLVSPEPIELAKLLDHMEENGIEPPSMLISERAIMTQHGYLEKAGYATYVVPGRLASPDGGIGPSAFSHGTKFLPWLPSSYIRPGMVWGASPETIQKFQPGGADTIRWWNARGPGAGIASIFVPVTDGTQQTELWQAPFDTYIEFMCANPKRNVRRIGFYSTKTA